MHLISSELMLVCAFATICLWGSEDNLHEFLTFYDVGSQGSNSGPQAWQQVSLPTEILSHKSFLFLKKNTGSHVVQAQTHYGDEGDLKLPALPVLSLPPKVLIIQVSSPHQAPRIASLALNSSNNKSNVRCWTAWVSMENSNMVSLPTPICDQPILKGLS